MQRIYLSVLGTNDYLLCSYFHGERETANVRFVQEATIRMLCKDWTEKDRVIEKRIPSRSEVFFDITHSFCSLPMLAMVALNYVNNRNNRLTLSPHCHIF